VGVLGGVALNRKARQQRKLLGVSVPVVAPGAEKVARQIGDAAAQFSRLASEVRAAREQVAKVGKALS
jgi:hypothetical protein